MDQPVPAGVFDTLLPSSPLPCLFDAAAAAAAAAPQGFGAATAAYAGLLAAGAAAGGLGRVSDGAVLLWAQAGLAGVPAVLVGTLGGPAWRSCALWAACAVFLRASAQAMPGALDAAASLAAYIAIVVAVCTTGGSLPTAAAAAAPDA